MLEARGKEDAFARQSQQQEHLDREYGENRASLLMEKTTGHCITTRQRQ